MDPVTREHNYNADMEEEQHEAGLLTDTERMAAQMLITSNGIAPLSLGDALTVVDYMRPKRVPKKTVFMRQGESLHNDFLMLILEGDATLELQLEGSGDRAVTTVVDTAGPGDILGEVSVYSTLPRTLSCIAASDMAVAILTRVRLQELYEKNPALAARFTFCMMARLSYKTQGNLSKLKKFVQMNDVLRYQLDKVMDTRAGGHTHFTNRSKK